MGDMLWQCDRNGCFLKRKVLKFEVLKDCLPGRMSFMDIDAAAEVNRHFMFMEWKANGHWLGTGQELFYRRLTQLPNVEALAVYGDAEHMRVTRVREIKSGKLGEWEPCDLNGLKDRLRKWSDGAMAKQQVICGSALAQRMQLLRAQRGYILNLEKTQKTIPELIASAKELQKISPSRWNGIRIRALEFLNRTS